jgi:hypothetical protein
MKPISDLPDWLEILLIIFYLLILVIIILFIHFFGRYFK